MFMTCIHFNGEANEAIEFYKTTLDATVKEINYAKDAPKNTGLDTLPPMFVMHSEVMICGAAFSITDGGTENGIGENISFLIMYETESEVQTIFDKLADGGQITQPLQSVFWSPLYGEVKDRFGVTWQVMVQH